MGILLMKRSGAQLTRGWGSPGPLRLSLEGWAQGLWTLWEEVVVSLVNAQDLTTARMQGAREHGMSLEDVCRG